MITGCAILDFNNESMKRIVQFVQNGTLFVVHNAIVNNPEYKPIFAIVNSALDIFNSGFDYSPETLKETISKELNRRGMSDYNDFVFNSMEQILNSYNTFYNLNIKSDPFFNESLVKDFINAIESGIKKGEVSAKDGEMLYGLNPLDDLPETFFLVK